MTSIAPPNLFRRAALILAILSAFIATAGSHAQDSNALSGRHNVVSVGLQTAEESNGEFGAVVAVERKLFQWGRRFSLGGGITSGIRRSHFEGILDSDYSVTVIPVSALLNLHYHTASAPRLDLYAGPFAGVSLRRYRSEGCAQEFDCSGERTSPFTAGIQWGARLAFRESLHGWSEASAGKHRFTFAIGLSRSF